MTDGLPVVCAHFSVSRFLVLLVIVGSTGVWADACHAQSFRRVGAGTPVPFPSEQEERPSFGRILGGSALGTSVGVGAGLLLLRASAEVGPGDDRYDRREDPESEAAATMALIGVAAIVAGGPLGAVEIGGIEHRRRDAYAAAGFGEVLFGILGVALARTLYDGQTDQLVGLGGGVVLGSAGGAYLVASQPRSEGMFNYQKGEWQIGRPNVQVRPHLTTDRAPSVNISLVSVQL
jgi:hypothetical protein